MNRLTDRQMGRLADRQIDKNKINRDRQSDGYTYRQKTKQTLTDKNIPIDRQAGKQIEEKEERGMDMVKGGNKGYNQRKEKIRFNL